MNKKLQVHLDNAKVSSAMKEHILSMRVPKYGDEGWRHLRPGVFLPSDGKLLLPRETQCPEGVDGLPEGQRVVIYNSIYDVKLSKLPQGVGVHIQDSTASHVIDAYQGVASMQPCVVITVYQSLDQPLYIAQVVQARGCGVILPMHTKVIVKDNVTVKVRRSIHVTEKTKGAVWSMMSYELGKNAQCDISEEHHSSIPMYEVTRSSLSSFSTLAQHTYLETSSVQRSIIDVFLEQSSNYELAAAQVGKRGGHGEVHVVAHHIGKQSTSTQRVRTVGKDNSQFSVHSTVHVDEHTPGCEGRQDLKALLLSKQSKVHLHPWLEIYTDEVVCSHGATIGHMDPDALSYLAMRGIGEVEAKTMLAEAFISEVRGDSI